MTSTNLDLEPATLAMSGILAGISADRLDRPTPCAEFTVRELLEHVAGLTIHFRHAASKTEMDAGDVPEIDDRGQWRDRVRADLAALAAAWSDPAAWTGTTTAGPLTLPAKVAASITNNELVIHGWDLARSTGQPYDCALRNVLASAEFLALSADPEQFADREGMFGRARDVPDDASPIDLAVALSGRDPSWGG